MCLKATRGLFILFSCGKIINNETIRENLPCSSCSFQWKSFCWSVGCCCCCCCWNCCCSCTKLYPTWFNPFLLYLTNRLALCLNLLSQQQRHRNANMEGLSTFPGAGGLRNPFSSCFLHSAGDTERVMGLTNRGHTWTLFIQFDIHCFVSNNFFSVVFCS